MTMVRVRPDDERPSDMTMVRAPPHEAPPRPTSQAPQGSRAEAAAAHRGALPKLGLEIDDQDSNTTILFNALDSDQLHALKRRLQAGLDGDDIDANRTLEVQAIRAVQLDELDRLLNSESKKGGPDPNATMQLDVVDDGTLDELEASLESEKRTRGVRKMSHALQDGARSPVDASSRGQGSPAHDLGDEEMVLALGRDVAAACAAVVAVVRRVVARVRAELRFTRVGARPPVRSTTSAEVTMPPTSSRGARRARWFKGR